MLKELIRPFQYPKTKWEAEKGSVSDSSSRFKPKAKAKNWAATLRRIWTYLAHSKGKLMMVLFLVVLSSGLTLLGPFLVGKAIDDYIVLRNNSGLLYTLLGLAGVYLLQSVTVWLQNYWMIGIAQKTVFTMRSQLFEHLHRLPIAYFDKRQHGELMSRVTNDIENVSSTLNSSFIQIFSSVLTLIGAISVMIWLSPLLTLITFLVVPAMFYGTKWITKRTGRLFKEQQKNLGQLNGHIEETISGQRIVKTFSQEKRVISEFKEKNERIRQSAFWAQTFTGFIPKVMNVLNNMSFALIAGVGGILAIQSIISIGAIVVFVEYSRQFTRPLNDLANQFNTLLSAVAGAERVFDILDEEAEEKEESESIRMPEIRGEVSFSNVSFSYEKGGDTIANVSFHAAPGETIAFVGPTGAGKTTLINLLSRFYDADSGVISIDGYDITKIKRADLRKQMAFVLQESFLFQGTVRDNIRYGRLEASDEEVEEAAQLADAHSFIMKMRDQYDTVLKPNGEGISQGQKQLLSIARAILANPTLLILDEATSSIDTVTEIKIQDALQRLMKGRTSFVIAHRLNTIQKADRIIVLQEGKINEAGSHEELLERRGFYYELHNRLITLGDEEQDGLSLGSAERTS
ncbi:ABC transporter ATP-binding protein [Paenibacillus sp. J2TS4]|uniref:ABC transporter ATP-binding protein n=1 Tax=Paenibacillus sp. J2TS4 TaxID=2807194 RepID=UPI001B240340|nr:ABC transporter ATP-binding protein [Paenibacillus sp. J2TS4]GIP31206.1 putative ABC transporter ATP-binding protein YfiC [Paenibacillus sp. J2TS4]